MKQNGVLEMPFQWKTLSFKPPSQMCRAVLAMPSSLACLIGFLPINPNVPLRYWNFSSRAAFNEKPGCLRFISQLQPSVLLMGVGGVHCCHPGKSSRGKRSPCTQKQAQSWGFVSRALTAAWPCNRWSKQTNNTGIFVQNRSIILPDSMTRNLSCHSLYCSLFKKKEKAEQGIIQMRQPGACTCL